MSFYCVGGPNGENCLGPRPCPFCGRNHQEKHPLALSKTQRRKQQRIAKKLRELAWEQQGRACYWCHEPIPLEAVTGDHVVEMSKGGKSKPSNVVAACEPCNMIRSNPQQGQQRAHVKTWRRYMKSIGRDTKPVRGVSDV